MIEVIVLYKSLFLLPLQSHASFFITGSTNTSSPTVTEIMYTSRSEYPIINHTVFKINVMKGEVTDN